MYKLPETPQTIFKTITYALKLWVHSYCTLIILTLIAILVGIFPSLFIPALKSPHLHTVYSYLLQHFGLLLIYFILSVYFFAAIFYRLSMFIHAEAGGLKRAFIVALKRLPCIVAGLIIVSVINILGFAFFIFPGIYLMFMLIFALPLIAAKGFGPFRAIKESWQLVKDHWWRTFFVLVLTMFSFQAIIVSIEYYGFDLLNLTDWTWRTQISYTFVRTLLNSIGYPLLCCLLLVLMHDLKLRKQTEEIEGNPEAIGEEI